MGFFDKLKKAFSGSIKLDDEFFDAMEETLILGDLGVTVATEAVEQLRTTIKKEHLQTEEEVKEALRRILNNLISNAVRYGGDGGYLGVSLREGEDALFLEVADRGKGVAPGAGEQVFQRLVTLEDSRSSGEGSGLGLSIARELARRMGGDIDLESVPGLRTVFTVRLPKWQDERDS